MSVVVQVFDTGAISPNVEFENVIGYVIAAVVRNPEDGAVTLERDISVHADNFDDNQLAESTVKEIEAALNTVFPDPNRPEPSELGARGVWVPE